MQKKLPKVKTRRGQALLEFAISITVVLLLVGSIIDLGRIYVVYSAISEGAREGALYGSATCAPADKIAQRVKDSAHDPVDMSKSTVEVQYDTSKEIVTVTVSREVILVGPLTASMFGGKITISATEKAVVLSCSS